MVLSFGASDCLINEDVFIIFTFCHGGCVFMEEFATRTSNAFHMISLSTYFYPVFCFCFINFVLLLYMFKLYFHISAFY